MRLPSLPTAVAVVASLLTAACNRGPDPFDEPAASPSGAGATASAVPTGGPTPAPAGATSPIPILPGLAFGRPVASTSAWQADATQISDDCRTYTATAYPQSYAIVIAGRLERVSFGRGSGFRLPSGIAPGSAEAEVRRAYPDLVAEPHKYAEAPAKYLTSAHLAPAAVGLRFEIDPDGRVGLIHIGLPSSLSLVEGCA